VDAPERPWGRVPAGFRRKWLFALADAALTEARLLESKNGYDNWVRSFTTPPGALPTANCPAQMVA
jgi:hypothetical protein